MLLSDKSALFALGFLGALGYYGLRAAARQTVVVIMPHDAAPFMAGMLQACRDANCMLHYIHVPDLYHRYDALAQALEATKNDEQLRGCPVVCKVLDEHMLGALELSGSRFVALMSPAWVGRSAMHIASLRTLDPSMLPPDTALVASASEWVPGAFVTDAARFIDDAVGLSKHARNLIVADWHGLVEPNAHAAAKLGHLYKSVRVLPALSYEDGYQAIRLAAAAAPAAPKRT
ncbi:hypothetical protein COO60DRAFT_1643837 [Scenedesmus sp. NREL 46B-D3]|nr:hypothetical protein COO60DRAFT_1643837 [Scenedesmus sp. NREL 46B-D3]